MMNISVSSTNRLTDLPMELSALEHLQIINLSMNKYNDEMKLFDDIDLFNRL